jgi:dUTP pyrophosphatase
LGQNAFVVEPKDRIAQLIVAQVTRIIWESAELLPETERGVGGFGSTGLRKIGV